MIKLIMPKRGNDKWGSGEFGASRDGGKRTHNGQDYLGAPGSIVLASKAGVVTKLGYPYGDDLSYRYVEVTDGYSNRWRYFYVSPTVREGQHLSAETPIGILQDLEPRYKGMANHCHLEVIDHSGNYLDPEQIK